MIILYSPFGQTSNQFIQHVSIDSFCLENGIKYYNPFFYKYKEDYPNLKLMKENCLLKNCMIFSHLTKINLAKFINFDITDNTYSSPQKYKNNLVYCYGWNFRAPKEVSKNRAYYQMQFQPNQKNIDLADKILYDKYDDQIVLGVHIRRGDYKTFENGIYYYDDEIYINHIKQVQDLVGSKCKIILFSNDKDLDIRAYKNKFSNVYYSDNSVAVDHYMMSKCSYLIGPPSTFTIWASFIGDVKCYHIKNRNKELTTDDFKIFSTL